MGFGEFLIGAGIRLAFAVICKVFRYTPGAALMLFFK